MSDIDLRRAKRRARARQKARLEHCIAKARAMQESMARLSISDVAALLPATPPRGAPASPERHR